MVPVWFLGSALASSRSALRYRGRKEGCCRVLVEKGGRHRGLEELWGVGRQKAKKDGGHLGSVLHRHIKFAQREVWHEGRGGKTHVAAHRRF